jgi:hypothetical protein
MQPKKSSPRVTSGYRQFLRAPLATHPGSRLPATGPIDQLHHHSRCRALLSLQPSPARCLQLPENPSARRRPRGPNLATGAASGRPDALRVEPCLLECLCHQRFRVGRPGSSVPASCDAAVRSFSFVNVTRRKQDHVVGQARCALNVVPMRLMTALGVRALPCQCTARWLDSSPSISPPFASRSTGSRCRSAYPSILNDPHI